MLGHVAGLHTQARGLQTKFAVPGHAGLQTRLPGLQPCAQLALAPRAAA